MSRLTTPEQAAANRRNASLSTGPKSDAGRAASSLNAMSYGLSGSGLHLPEREADRAREIEAGLVASLRPTNAAEDLLVKQMAVSTVKGEQARALQIELRAALAQRAEAAWVCDRQAETAELARRLGDDPERITPTLLGSLQGAEWLASRWAGLKRKLEQGGVWDEGDRKLALDLLAFPLDFRDKTLPGAAEIPDASELRSAHLALAERELGNLRSRIATDLAQLDEADLDRARRGVESHKDRDIRLFRRYEREAARRFEWAWNELKRLRRERNEANSPAPAAPVEPQADLETAQAEVVEELLAEFEEVAPAAVSSPLDAPTTPKGNRRHRRMVESERRKVQYLEKMRR